MSSDYNIQMSIDDTLELDSIIEKWSKPNDTININRTDHDLDGIKKYTGVFNPKGTGEYEIEINGQTILVNVIGSSVYEPPDNAVHNWKFSNGSGTELKDSIGNADGTINNASWINGSWVDSVALDGDGANDYVQIPKENLTDTDPLLDNKFAVAYTISGYSGSGGSLIDAGWNNGDTFGVSFSNGSPFLSIRDTNNNGGQAYPNTSNLVDDGNKHRVILQKTSDGHLDQNAEVWVDNTEYTDIRSGWGDNSNSSFDNWNNDLMLLASNDDSDNPDNYCDAILDNVVLINGNISSKEIEKDYNNQPWS